jgi:hypothetical protein
VIVMVVLIGHRARLDGWAGGVNSLIWGLPAGEQTALQRRPSRQARGRAGTPRGAAGRLPEPAPRVQAADPGIGYVIWSAIATNWSSALPQPASKPICACFWRVRA